MKVLLVSNKGDGVWYSALMIKNGHKVDTFVAEPKYADALEGIIPPVLSKLPNPEPYDLIVFDSDGMGEEADLARVVTPVVGGSALADRLEEDRLFGLEVMEQSGIKVPTWEAFDSPEKGIAWLEQTKKRTVFKPIGEVEDKSTTYVSKDHKDMIVFMDRVFKKAKIKSYVLQEVVQGPFVETAVCGWFNGEEWVLVDHNLEEKKMMPGGIGPNTGCAAMVTWIPPKPTPLFEQGLGRITEFLREHNYVGPIDLNTIVTEGTAYGIEWTPRFGYEGTPNLTRQIQMEWGEFLYRVATGATVPMAQPRSPFSATIRVSVPPYPNADLTKKPVIVPVRGVNLDKLDTMVLYDVRATKEEGVLETTGAYNCVGAPIGLGNTIHDAFNECEVALKGLDIPDMMWRNDVAKCIEKRYAELQRMGWLRSIG